MSFMAPFLALLCLCLIYTARASNVVYPRGFQVGIYAPVGNPSDTVKMWRPTVDRISTAAMGAPGLLNTTVVDVTGSASQIFKFDYIYAPSSVLSCLEFLGITDQVLAISPRNWVPVATQVSFGEDENGVTQDFSSVCGAVIKRRDRDVQLSRQGLSNATIAMIHPLASEGGLLQLHWMLKEHGLDVSSVPKKLMISVFDLQVVVQAVLDGTADLGFISNIGLFRLKIRGLLTDAQIAQLELVEPKTYAAFPFKCTTTLTAGFSVIASPWVPLDEVVRVRAALLSIVRTDTEAVYGNYSSFVTPLSGMASVVALQSNQLLGPVPSRPACNLNPADIYSSLSCATADHFKLDRTRFWASCPAAGERCPRGFLCVCRPCRPIPQNRYHIFTTAQLDANTSAYGALFDSVTASRGRSDMTQAFEECQKLRRCASFPVNSTVKLLVVDSVADFLGPLGLNATDSVQVSITTPSAFGPDARDFIFQNALSSNVSGVWALNITPYKLGTYLVQVRANGQDIQNAPIFFEVVPKVCGNGTFPTIDGGCLELPVADGGDDLSGGAIAGIVVGSVGFVLLIVGLVIALAVVTRLDIKRYKIELNDIKLYDVEQAAIPSIGMSVPLLGELHANKVAVIPIVGVRQKGWRKDSRFISLFTGGSEIRNPRNSGTRPDSQSRFSIDQQQRGASLDLDAPSPRSPSAAHTNTASSALVVKEIVRLCRVARHKNLTIAYGFCQPKSEVYLVEESSESGTLEALLFNRALVLEPLKRMYLARDVAAALNYLHSMKKPMGHGAVSLDSVIIFEQNDFVLAKLGWAAHLTDALKLTVEEAIAKDIYDMGFMLLQMFYNVSQDDRSDFEAFSTLAQTSYETFCETINRLEVPVRIRNCIMESMNPVPSRRPSLPDIVRLLDRAVDAEKEIVATRRRLSIAGNKMDGELIDKLFPPRVARALRAGRKVEPMMHQDLTLLFSDIVGFTELSSKLDSRDVQETLNGLFAAFDQVVRKHECFKLEIIGDAYLVVGGLLDNEPPNHTSRIARVALEMVTIVKQFKFTKRHQQPRALMSRDEDSSMHGAFPSSTPDASAGGDPAEPDAPLETFDVKIRIGIHQGPAVSTVLGNDRPRFALMGDTMNTCSRLESNSAANKINLSVAAATRLRKTDPELALHLKVREPIDVKGKGLMTMFWLSVPGVTSNDTADGSGPLLPTKSRKEKSRMSRMHSIHEGPAGQPQNAQTTPDTHLAKAFETKSNTVVQTKPRSLYI